MDAARARRTFKDRSRSAIGDDPSTAVVTLRAEGRLGSEEVACSVETGRAVVEAGSVRPATGGDGRARVLGRHAPPGLGRLRRGDALRSVRRPIVGWTSGGSVHAEEGTSASAGSLGVDQ